MYLAFGVNRFKDIFTDSRRTARSIVLQKIILFFYFFKVYF